MKQWHLLAYDVRDEKRLRKLHYYLRKQAMPVQKSVFLVHCTNTELNDILQGVRERVHLRDDDIRLYPINSPHSIWAAGQQHQAVQGLYISKSPPKEVNNTNWLQQIVKTLFG